MKGFSRLRHSRLLLSCVVAALAVFAALMVVVPVLRRPVRADRVTLLEVAKRYPNYTRAQQLAVLREMQSELHPKFRDLSLSQIAARLLKFATSATSNTGAAPLADLQGNQTIIAIPQTDLLLLSRQADCSLTLRDAQFTLQPPSFSYVVANSIAGYDQVLHSAAGLTTTGGKFAAGCGDPTLGVSSRKLVYLGKTTSNLKVYAGTFYDSVAGAQAIYTVVADADDTFVSSGETTGYDSQSVAAADLNKDGNGDVVSVNAAETSGASSTVTVMLGNADGSLQTPVSYAISGGALNSSAVIDDFNGDGIPDIVVEAEVVGSGTEVTGTDLSFLAGKGDGTFKTPTSVSLTPPAGLTGGNLYGGLVSASLRNNGKKDLVTAGGIVLLGNGDGTFAQSSTLAFASSNATSDYGPNLAAADLNKDGKIDLAFDNGGNIEIYLGKGDGTFTTGATYATTNNVGYITATDLDGDGNIDLFTGLANGGALGGDQFDYGEAYALMGNGDGTFRGASDTPFVFTGTNVVDLNKDGKLDGVGVNANFSTSTVSFTSYLGNSNGTFSAKATLQVSPITVSGQQYSFTSIDSFGFGDVNGDGIQDLVYMTSDQNGFFAATGKGDGSFNTPTFNPTPSLVPAGDDNLFAKDASQVFVADFNHDGNADVLYSYNDQGTASQTYYQGFAIQLSNGNGTFQAPKLLTTYSGATAPSGEALLGLIGDANSDGYPDLFVIGALSTSNQNPPLQIYLGKGDGSFGAGVTVPVQGTVGIIDFGSNLAPMALADMNGDGHPDLIAMAAGSGNVTGGMNILLGKGDGTFAAPFVLNCYSCGGLGGGVAVADFNGDGKLDVAASGFDPPYDTGIYTGNGDGTVNSFNPGSGMAAQPALGIGLLVDGAAMAADFNGDGKPDLLMGDAVLLSPSATTTTPLATKTTLTAGPNPATVGQSVTLTATVAPASGSGTPTGIVTFYDSATKLGTGTLSSGTATYSTSSLAAGTHSITASYGSDSTYAVSTSAAVSVVVSTATLIGTTTKLTASASSISTGGSVTLSAVVTPASGTATPSGAVTFLNGSTSLGTGTLDGSGKATLNTTALPAGTDSITAQYGGNSTFASSTSTAVSIVVGATPAFSLSLSPATLTITGGSTGSTTVTATPSGGFTSTLSFTCSGLPAYSACAFSPATVTPSGSAASTTKLTITTNTGPAMLAKDLPRGQSTNSKPLLCAVLLGSFGLLSLGRVRKMHKCLRIAQRMTLLALPVLALVLGALTGCGGGDSPSTTPKGTSSVTVTASGGGQTQTATLSLTVQ